MWRFILVVTACSPGPTLDTSGRNVMIVDPSSHSSCAPCDAQKRPGERLRRCEPDWEFHDRDHYRQKPPPPPGVQSIDARLGPWAFGIMLCSFEVTP